MEWHCSAILKDHSMKWYCYVRPCIEDAKDGTKIKGQKTKAKMGLDKPSLSL